MKTSTRSPMIAALAMLSGVLNTPIWAQSQDPVFEEQWESAAIGSHSPEDFFLPADAGTWWIGDTVSEFPDCGESVHRAKISIVDGSKALTLVSKDTNSGCADNVWVAFQELAAVELNPGFSIPVTGETIIRFNASGELDNPQSGRDTCLARPCGDTISLTLQVLPSGSELAYILQRAPDAVPNTRQSFYREIFLDPDAGSYGRNLLNDLMTIPNFSPVGAEVRFIEFAIDEHGSATLDNLLIGKGKLPDRYIFLDLAAVADANGNNNTDLGVLMHKLNADRNLLYVMDGGSGKQITSTNFGVEQFRSSTIVSDANGDTVPEFGVLVEGSLFARVKDIVNNTLVGKPGFNVNYDPVAFLSVGDAGGSVGPDVAFVGRDDATGKVKAWVKEAASGKLISRMSFSKAFVPFAAVAVDNVGDSKAMEIAVLGIDASGKVQVQVRDALSGKLISNIKFNKQFTPLFFAAVPNAAGKLKYLAVLGRNASGVIQAQIKRVGNGTLVNNVTFSKRYDPRALISFADSNGSGGGEIGVVGVNGDGAVRAQVKEIADGTKVATINFSKAYLALDAIAVNGVAGTAQNEIAVLGRSASDKHRLQIKDLLTGDLVKNIPVP